MAVDLKLLAKLLALSRSHEPAEAALALSRFSSLITRWRDEVGLPVDTGYVNLAEPDRFTLRLAEALAPATGAIVLSLEPFELIVAGSERDCHWLWWWFVQARREIEKTAIRANNHERYIFSLGAVQGIETALAQYSTGAHRKVERVPVRAITEAEKVEGAGPRETEPPDSPPQSTPQQRSTFNAGLNYGLRLAHELLKVRPPNHER